MNARTPKNWPTVIPRIVSEDVEGVVQFIKRVFDAEGAFHATRPAEMRIGDSIVMVSGIEPRDAFPAFLYVYVADVDSVYSKALAAGATSIEAPQLMPYGDRRAMVRDPWSNIWQIATYVSRSSMPIAINAARIRANRA